MAERMGVTLGSGFREQWASWGEGVFVRSLRRDIIL